MLKISCCLSLYPTRNEVANDFFSLSLSLSLSGLQSKLDYIDNLGVKGVALSPLLKVSAGGSDEAVEDFKDIDSRYGTLEDFKSLIASLKTKGKCFDMSIAVVTKSVPDMGIPPPYL